MTKAGVESSPASMRWRNVETFQPPEGADIETAEGGKLWRFRPQKHITLTNAPIDQQTEFARRAAKQDAQFTAHVIEVMKARYLAEFEEGAEKIVERVVEVPMLSPNPVRHMIPDEIRNLMQEGESLSSAKRRLTELLWVEQAELRNLRATDRENLKREAEIERLLGLFARLGEI